MSYPGPGKQRPSTHRQDGYAPLAGYAGIGDGRSVALIAADSAVDWWALPDLDSEPAFGALLDPVAGGRIVLAPAEEFTVERGYLGDTNVLETVFTTATGQVCLTDSLNTGVAGRLPWSELARRVEGVSGRVAMRWLVQPGTALGTLSPWVTDPQDASQEPLLRLGKLSFSVRHSGVGEAEIDQQYISGRFTTEPGSRGVLGVVCSHDEPLFLPSPEAVDKGIDRTILAWQEWSDNFSWDGPSRAAVLRSSLVLKLLLHSPTGSIAAAATTSLPEKIGSDKNYDYRYTWVRDTGYTLDAFVRCGFFEEVHAALAWLLRTVEIHGPQLKPFYTLHGQLPGQRQERSVPGYRASLPVADGNAAAAQLQLGPYGDLMQTVYLCVQQGHRLDARTQRLLADLADRCCEEWQLPDAGMWELPQEQHYTTSKVSCWQALDRAARLAEAGQLPGTGTRWRQEADRIQAWVAEHCWSGQRQAYTTHPGTDDLDAGVLLAARFGFDRGERMTSTIAAIQRELGRGPWLYRYTGMPAEEGAFLACTFWAVEALAFTGQPGQAQELLDDALNGVDHTVMLTEMSDPDTGEMLGNIPQALSHLALINAACAIAETS